MRSVVRGFLGVLLLLACSLSPISRVGAIVGGDDVGPYPWAAALLSANYSQTMADRFQCSGALLKPKWVLTAAHCFIQQPGESRPPLRRGDTVLIGRDHLASTTQGEGRSVVDFKLMVEDENHCRSKDLRLCDLALVELSSASSLGDLDLANGSVLDEWGEGSPARVYGYGGTSYNGAPTLDLRRAHVTITDLRQNHHTLFASGAKGSTCSGDSGGPLIVSTAGGPRLVGVARALTVPEDCSVGLEQSYTKVGFRGTTTNSPAYYWIVKTI